MICTMPECQTTAGCLCRLAGIVTDASYIAPFVPSLADDYYSKVIAQKDAELERLRREVEELKADKARLDFLDECNARLNTHHSTTYGWEMVMNHNVNRLMTGHLAVDLNDAKAHGFKSCRGAIDSEIKRIEAARAAREKAEETGHE